MSNYHVSVKVKTPDGVKSVSVKRTYATKEAATKAGERLLADVKASGLIPVSTFALRTDSGKEVRPYLSKEEYNDLYYWVMGDLVRNYNYDPDKILTRASKRYDTLDQVRKSAINQSKKVWDEINYFGSNRNIDVQVFKGKKFLGTVTYNILKGKKPMFDKYEGIWSPAEHPKDEQLLKKDGSTL